MRGSLFAFVAFILAASPVGAQDKSPVGAQHKQTVEVTPYVAVGSAGASPVGVTVTFPVASALSVETEVAYRHGEGIHALSSSGSLLYSLPPVGQVTPYVVGGLGLSQYGSPVAASNGGRIGSQSRVAVTLNTGAGLKILLKDNLDV